MMSPEVWADATSGAAAIDAAKTRLTTREVVMVTSVRAERQAAAGNVADGNVAARDVRCSVYRTRTAEAQPVQRERRDERERKPGAHQPLHEGPAGERNASE